MNLKQEASRSDDLDQHPFPPPVVKTHGPSIPSGLKQIRSRLSKSSRPCGSWLPFKTITPTRPTARQHAAFQPPHRLFVQFVQFVASYRNMGQREHPCYNREQDRIASAMQEKEMSRKHRSSHCPLTTTH